MRHKFYINLFILALVLLSISSFFVNATQDYAVITADNVAQLTEIQRLGNGYMNDALAWSQDGSLIAVGGKRGLWLYSSLDGKPEFYEINVSDKAFNVDSILFAPDGNLVLLSDGEQVIAYNIEQQSIQYIIEGRRVLTTSNNQDWFAYEVVTGVRVAEIETGNIVYDLSYVGELYWLDESETDGHYADRNSINYAQFMPDDKNLIVRWETSYVAHYFAGFDIWSLDSSESFRTGFDEAYAFGQRNMELVFLAPDGTIRGVDEGKILSTENIVPLEDAATQFTSPSLEKGDIIASFVAGNYGHEREAGNPDSRQRMTGIWDIDTGEQIMRIPDTGKLVLSPDNTKIAINRTIYDIATGESLVSFQTDVYEPLSHGNRILLYGVDNTVRLLDSISHNEIAILPMSRNEISWHSLYGETLLLNSEDRQHIVSVSLITGGIIANFESDDPLLAGGDFNSDGRYLLTTDYGSVKLLWNAKTGEQISLPDYDILASYFVGNEIITWHPESSSVVFYDVVVQKPMKSFFVGLDDVEIPQIVQVYAEQYVVVVADDTIHIYDWETGEQLLSLDTVSYVYHVSFNTKSQYFAYQTPDWNIEVISLPEGNHIGTIESYQNMDFGFGSESTIYIANDYGFIEYYDIETGEVVDPPALPEREPSPILKTESLRFFKSDTVLQIEDMNGTILTQLETGQSYHSIHLSSDETRLFVDYFDGTVGIWAVNEE